MRRRDVLRAAALVLPWTAQAQEPGRTYRLGLLVPFPRNDPAVTSALEGLATMGFVEGKNLVVVERGIDPQQFPALARQLVQANVDLLMVGGPSIRAAQSASNTSPIVGLADDMVQEGYVGSLANRTGNTTGVSILATELDTAPVIWSLMPASASMNLLTVEPVPTPTISPRSRASAS